VVRLSSADPLNLVGIVLPGQRVPALSSNTVCYVDGLVAGFSELADSILTA
jgi:ATP-dependent Lhr-like helicase